MAEAEAAYNVYAKNLVGRRHGHPLWLPEPNEATKARIGDVGYLMNGGFYRIFNTTLPRDDPSNQHGVPTPYEPFQIKPMLLRETKGVVPSHLCSGTVSSMGIGGEVVTSVTPVGAGLKFQCSSEQGAFVFIDKPADRTQMHPSKKFANYMKTNIESWHNFATQEHDLNIQKEDLIFISGVIMTNDWGLGAFLNHGHCGEVSFQAQMGPFLNGTFQFNLKKGNVGNAEWRVRPDPDPVDGRPPPSPSIQVIEAPGDTSSIASPLTESHMAASISSRQKVEKDQCLFIHFYKMKKRFWRNRVISAAAGPDERDPDTSTDGMSPAIAVDDFDIEEVTSTKPYNAVDSLLDYILDYVTEDGHQAAVAIASPAHLYALFDGDLPLDIRGELDRLRPTVIFVDDEREMAALASAEWTEDFDNAEENTETEPVRDTNDSIEAPVDVPDTVDDEEIDAAKYDIDEKEARYIPGMGGANQIVLQEHTGSVTCVACSPDGQYLASGSEDATVILRDASTGAAIQTFSEHHDSIWSIAFSPDSSRLASGGSDGLALVFDVELRALAIVLDGHTGVVQSIGYSPDGSKVVTASVDFTVRVWDALTGDLVHRLEAHMAVVTSAVFSPDGRWIGSCGADGRAKIWDAQNGTLLHSLDEHTGVVWTIAFSPDGRRVATGADDSTCRIWNAETGDELVTLREHNGAVWAVSFSPDGKCIMSAANDATIKICDSFSGEEEHVLDRHDTLVNSAVYSKDGKYVVSSAADNAVMVWDTTTGEHLPAMEGHQDKVTALQFLPDCERVVSCSDDGTVRIWTFAGHGDSQVEVGI